MSNVLPRFFRSTVYIVFVYETHHVISRCRMNVNQFYQCRTHCNSRLILSTNVQDDRNVSDFGGSDDGSSDNSSEDSDRLTLYHVA